MIKKYPYKLILSIVWFLFTFSMVTWWWIFSLRQLQSLASSIAPEKYESLHWMLLWEGSILLIFIFAGGLSLLIYTYRERLQSERLRLFFSNFSHDLKTSLTRLHLRTEVLAAKNNQSGFSEILTEVNRLDLQLENSLWIARGEDHHLTLKSQGLGEMIGQFRIEWPEMEVHLQRDAVILVDPLAIRSVLRNILQNSWLHGQATRIDIFVEEKKSNHLKITFHDNGQGFKGDLIKLGKGSLPSSSQEGNGIGLYLSQLLVERMKGGIHFETASKGFKTVLELQGSLK